MGLFSDSDIEHAILAGRIKMDPEAQHLIQPASIDVRLDEDFLIWTDDATTAIDPREPQHMTPVRPVRGEAFELAPGQFALGSTVERLTLSGGIAARLEGKSSLGRLGLLTHATAGFIDPGFSGHITLELVNLSQRPLKLLPGMAIGQLCFFSLVTPSVTPYGDDRGSHYQDQSGPTPSRSYEQFQRPLPTPARRPRWMAPAPTTAGAPL